MSTESVRKIGRGVDAIDRAKAQIKTPRLANLAKAPTTPAEIQKYAATFKERRDRMRAIHAEDGTAMEKRTLEIRAEVEGLGLDKSQTMQLIDKAIIHARKERGLDTAEERAKVHSDNRTDASTLNTIKALWHSPEAVLLAGTLGSANRATYAANLANANVTELNNAMVKAITTPDRDLAAACCARFDTLNRDQKTLVKFTKTELAETLVPEFAIVQEAFALSDLYHEQAKLTALEIDGKRISPDQKIKIGTMMAELESRLGVDPENSDVPKNETFEQRLDRLYPGRPLPAGWTTFKDGKPEAEQEISMAEIRKADKEYWAAEEARKGGES